MSEETEDKNLSLSEQQERANRESIDRLGNPEKRERAEELPEKQKGRS